MRFCRYKIVDVLMTWIVVMVAMVGGVLVILVASPVILVVGLMECFKQNSS